MSGGVTGTHVLGESGKVSDDNARDAAILALQSGKLDTSVATATYPTISVERKDVLLARAMPKQNGGTPTLTLSAAGAATSITSPVGVAGNDAAIRYTAVATASLVSGLYYTGVTPSPSTLDRGIGYFTDYWIDTAKFEHKLYGNAATRGYKAWVDGVAINAEVQAGPAAADGLVYRLLFDFGGTRGVHHIRVLQNSGFTGLVVGPTDSVWLPAHPIHRKRAFFLGDSYENGSNATYSIQGLPFVLSELMAWEPFVDGESGTGFTNAGSGGGRDTYANRVTALAAYAPDIVVVSGSINDDSASAATIQAAATSVFSQLASQLPNAEVYVTGPPYASAAANATRDANDAAVQAAAALATNVKGFISLSGWITGTGKIGALTGTGNADVYTASDGIHATAAGHRFLGTRIAQRITALL